ncbi:hypothetical protein [Clostridium saccharobutylicum]|uniref:hypothetical protein n=1 Tax=Clostridium saccharobutylicum TaxID=169679 RepID=UPI00098C080F|nr:hypothetical protein [Clostridium saccharobutylicum]
MRKIEYKFCKFCNKVAHETHHIFYRSQVKSLINCKLNQVSLCNECHSYLHRGKKGYELDHALKIELLNYFEIVFDRQAFTLEEINSILNISNKALYGLSKHLKIEKGKYTRESLLLALQGGENIQERYEMLKAKEGVKYGT